jgi:flavin-dependent dehydrogenase
VGCEAVSLDNFTDILIVGGGPSGAYLGKLLATAGRDVVLLSGKNPSKPFYETVASRAISDHSLPALMRCAGAVSFWDGDFPADRPGVCSPWGNDFFVERPKFEQELRKQAIAAGARELAERVTSAALGRDRDWEIRGWTGKIYRSSILIDATGRNSSIGRYLGASRQHRDRLIAVPFRLAYSESNLKTFYHTTVVPDENGWWYIGPAPGNQVFAVYYTDTDLLRSMKLSDLKGLWSRLCGRLNLIDLELGACERSLPAMTAIISQFNGDGWYGVGDAVATFDPLSSFGLTFALQSAELVAQCILGAATPATYRARVMALMLEYVITRQETYRRQTRWPANPFWLRRAGQRAPKGGIR